MSRIRDAGILTLITLIAGLTLGGVYELTKDTIARQEIEANLQAYQEVFPEAAEFGKEEALTKSISQITALLKETRPDLGNVRIDDALYAYDSAGDIAGVLVSTTSRDGYGGDIRIVTGILSDENKFQRITGIEYLEINETAGLGMRATESSFKKQYYDKTAERFEVVKGGSAAIDQIDALTGATKTSAAVTNAVNAALYFAKEAARQ